MNNEFTGLDADSISVFGGDGADTVTGSEFDDSLSGGGENDILIGGDGDDKLYGGAGDDTLHGQDGNDDIYGDGVLVIRQIASGDGDARELVNDSSVDLSMMLVVPRAHGISTEYRILHRDPTPWF